MSRGNLNDSQNRLIPYPIDLLVTIKSHFIYFVLVLLALLLCFSLSFGFPMHLAKTSENVTHTLHSFSKCGKAAHFISVIESLRLYLDIQFLFILFYFFYVSFNFVLAREAEIENMTPNIESDVIITRFFLSIFNRKI